MDWDMYERLCVVDRNLAVKGHALRTCTTGYIGDCHNNSDELSYGDAACLPNNTVKQRVRQKHSRTILYSVIASAAMRPATLLLQN